MHKSIIISSTFSILISSALCNTIGKFGLPYFTMPFNMVAILCFLSIKPDTINSPEVPEALVKNVTEDIDWNGVGRGMVLSMGQVYAINDLRTSLLMNLAVFLYSPLLFFTSSIGAIAGSLGGM